MTNGLTLLNVTTVLILSNVVLLDTSRAEFRISTSAQTVLKMPAYYLKTSFTCAMMWRKMSSITITVVTSVESNPSGALDLPVRNAKTMIYAKVMAAFLSLFI